MQGDTACSSCWPGEMDRGLCVAQAWLQMADAMFNGDWLVLC